MKDLLDFIQEAVVPCKFDTAQPSKGFLLADGDRYTVYLNKLRYSHSNEIMVNPDRVIGIEVDYDNRKVWVKADQPLS